MERTVRLALLMLSTAALALTQAASCGTDTVVTGGDAAAKDGASSATDGSGDGPGPAALDATTEAATGSDAATPEAGPGPVVKCADDASIQCPLPPSVCLDDQHMQYFYGASCGDAGLCVYASSVMQCPPSPTPPDCYMGGCRIVVVR